MRTKTIEAGGVSVTLSESTIEMEIRRGYLADDGIRAAEARQGAIEAAAKSGQDIAVDDLDDPIIRMMRTFTWPTFTACVVSAVGVELPITFEAFRAMPGPLLSEWADALYELNPSWKPAEADKEPPKADIPTTSAEG
jgi:hypothetical protein